MRTPAPYPASPELDKTNEVEGKPAKPRKGQDFRKILASKPQPLALKLLRPKVK